MSDFVFAVRRFVPSNLGWFHETRKTIGEAGRERAININADVIKAWYPEGTEGGRRVLIGCRYFSGKGNELSDDIIVENARPIANQGGGKNWRLTGEAIRGKFYGTIRKDDLMLMLFDRKRKVLSWMCVRGSLGDQNERTVYSQILKVLGSAKSERNMWMPSSDIAKEIIELATRIHSRASQLFDQSDNQPAESENGVQIEAGVATSPLTVSLPPMPIIISSPPVAGVPGTAYAEREFMVIELVKEVLGPRNGPHELLPLNQDPRDEYITGVLVPENTGKSAEDIEAQVDEIIEENYSEEDEGTNGSIVVPGEFSPALDPKSLPRSIGLSFVVEAETGSPEIEVCASWARYYPQEQQGWQRQPSTFLTGTVRIDMDRRWEAAPGVSLQMRVLNLAADGWKVSLFLINTTEFNGEGRPSTEQHIFQPQIRVHCRAGTHSVPVWTADIDRGQAGFAGSMASEDASLSLLYRERAALARGHLCGAIWRDIDPERLYVHHQLPAAAPFFWTDSAEVSIEEGAKFSPSDLRTEMVPCFPIEAPQMNWDLRYTPSPVLNPEELAETWEPTQIKVALQPLVNGYNAWIEDQLTIAANLPPEQRAVADEHLQECMQVSERIQHAIDLIAIDEDVRLAFCFANKAIALQSQWKNRALIWRPFQLAFILLNVPAVSDPLHEDRRICDLLWFPTGGGKTEAYLGLASFTLALRRRRALQVRNPDANNTGAGVGVLSRYTLRLLTIQQFRRALGVITACDVLRVRGLDSPGTPVGWRPGGCGNATSFLWGGSRFSIGLWVGGGVTPNNTHSIGPVPTPRFKFFTGGLDILRGVSEHGYDGPDQRLRDRLRGVEIVADGEPAQVLNCPCCDTTLAVPNEGFGAGQQHTIHFVFRCTAGVSALPLVKFQPATHHLVIDAAILTNHPASDFYTLSLTFTLPVGERLIARSLDIWWYDLIAPALGSDVELVSARPSRPGYFILNYTNNLNNAAQCDFDIYCPNPDCELNQKAWAEQIPVRRDDRAAGGSTGFPPTVRTNELPVQNNLHWQAVPSYFSFDGRQNRISGRVPIPAMTVDDQIYHRCPSIVIATVDKFARLAFEPKAASLFGNVDHYHSRWGYYRQGSPPNAGNSLPANYSPHPPVAKLRTPVLPFPAPDLILQDELHLIEGPLGSMFGIYETAIHELCRRGSTVHSIIPKYVASTATVRQAQPQVQALFNRRLMQFPPPAISVSDRFFARDEEIHPLECTRPGRLYVAICAPGKGAPTPRVRIWSVLLQSAYEMWQRNPGSSTVDSFYTLVGYFNAVRELAGTVSLYRQDIPERMSFRWGSGARQLEADRPLELSGRVESLDLPALLKSLEDVAPDAKDAVFATSMFGTGVDVDRLSLMVVHGQPKTTASYIQATGRVGRRGGGLVVTFFQASRPRDLDHYEFFTGYHRALYRHVEPVAVAPFSPRARERALGPLSVAMLRQANKLSNQPVDPEWQIQQRLSQNTIYCEARRMRNHRRDPEVNAIPPLFEARAIQQPEGRRPQPNITAQEAASELDRWTHLAALHPDTDQFVYAEPAVIRSPQRHVVLGDAHHRTMGLGEAYENAPQSLREVEETTGFKS